ncbi:hypothetical protein HPB51_006015 [Rhipicephalus microplus]|uniref:Tick transposon n=1 Tax=Rhipicephalus microplus TaxID=6941 RepID=A0A9J6EF97_RHIMP|nr:hypothetical protein HPB51_006015 [Rhipicephalus microplus]
MNPEYNKGRRVARARTIIDVHANDAHPRYVDAAQHQRNAFAAVVIESSTSATRIVASVKNSRAEQVEEVAIALTDTACYTVLSDSRQVLRNIAKGQICKEAEGKRLLMRKEALEIYFSLPDDPTSSDSDRDADEDFAPELAPPDSNEQSSEAESAESTRKPQKRKATYSRKKRKQKKVPRITTKQKSKRRRLGHGIAANRMASFVFQNLGPTIQCKSPDDAL